jgi:hypothetical protein
MARVRRDADWIYGTLQKAYERESGREVESVSKIQLKPIVPEISTEAHAHALLFETDFVEFEIDLSRKPRPCVDLDWRKYEFVTTVQSALIVDAMTRAEKGASSPVRLMTNMRTLFDAAVQLPDDIVVYEAAWRFAHWLISLADKRSDLPMPSWYTETEW